MSQEEIAPIPKFCQLRGPDQSVLCSYSMPPFLIKYSRANA